MQKLGRARQCKRHNACLTEHQSERELHSCTYSISSSQATCAQGSALLRVHRRAALAAVAGQLGGVDEAARQRLRLAVQRLAARTRQKLALSASIWGYRVGVGVGFFGRSKLSRARVTEARCSMAGGTGTGLLKGPT